MNLAWTVERDGGVSLVRCRVHNDSAVPRRVRVESRLDGPVFPPRRAGVPEAGWDDAGVTLRLEADERRAIGFAVPAPPVEPPVAVVRSPSVDADGGRSESVPGAVGPTPEGRSRVSECVGDALRDLAEHRPPRAAVTAGGDGRGAARSEGTADDGVDIEEVGSSLRGDDSGAAVSTRDGRKSVDFDAEAPPREAVDEWFDAAERRIERAERVTDADLQTATEVVESAGGVDGVAALDERVAVDSERLREIEERASSLAARAEATDAPVEAMERLS